MHYKNDNNYLWCIRLIGVIGFLMLSFPLIILVSVMDACLGFQRMDEFA